MQDILFDPANEWHEYKGCRLLRARAVFTAKEGFVFVDNPHVKEIHLIDMTDQHSAHTDCYDKFESISPQETSMVAGYIILSIRTTLAMFRGILPGTTRFFFLSLPLLRLLRGRVNHPTPAWCAHTLHAMQLLVEKECINKGSMDCMGRMSSYYTGIACLVLFDARGAVESEHGAVYLTLTICTVMLLVALKFLPAILHRPQQLVDLLCGDMLCITAHAACISMIVDTSLKHGCALHSTCFILQHRFIGRMPSLASGTVVHTVLILILLFAYTHGPRIPDVQRFMLSAVCPHALELIAQLLTHAHRVAVIMRSGGDTY